MGRVFKTVTIEKQRDYIIGGREMEDGSIHEQQLFSCPYCHRLNIMDARHPKEESFCEHFLSPCDENDHGVPESFLFTNSPDKERMQELYDEWDMRLHSNIQAIAEAIDDLYDHVPPGISGRNADTWREMLQDINNVLIRIEDALWRRTFFMVETEPKLRPIDVEE